MKLQEVKNIAKKMGIKAGSMKKDRAHQGHSEGRR